MSTRLVCDGPSQFGSPSQKECLGDLGLPVVTEDHHDRPPFFRADVERADLLCRLSSQLFHRYCLLAGSQTEDEREVRWKKGLMPLVQHTIGESADPGDLTPRRYRQHDAHEAREDGARTPTAKSVHAIHTPEEAAHKCYPVYVICRASY